MRLRSLAGSPPSDRRRIRYDRGMAVTCDFCGTQAEGDTPPLTWVSAVERGQSKWFCERCSREHLRSIESKLDSEWW